MISDRHVLSAAHCFVGVTSPSTHVRLGDHDVTTTSDGVTAEDVRIARFVTHEQYSRQTLQNDISLITLERSVAFRPGIRAACLPYQVI